MRFARNIWWAAVLTSGIAGAAAGQSQAVATRPANREITLMEGRGDLLQFATDIKTIAISEPKIADAVVVSPREVMVNAKSPGATTLVVWEGEAAPQRFEIRVSKDNAEWEGFLKSIQENANGAPVLATGTPENIVLTGSVKSAADSKRLASLAQTRAKTVVNLLQAPAAPPLRQILLQVKIADVDRSALTQIGFNIFSTNQKGVGAISTGQFSSPRFSPLTTGGGTANGNTVNFSDLLNLFAFRPDLNLGATIAALQERDLIQILAEPNLICLEGKDASFLAGGSFPYPTITTTPTGGATAPVITVRFQPFGVKLDFTPTVTEDGMIDLKVSPEVSSLDYSNAVTLEGFTIPALSQRKADTEVVLKDGESFAIAGLINNQVVQTVDKFPGLGSIPILGKLFTSRSTKKSDDELLVVITPHFVRPLTASENARLPDMPATFLPTVIQEQSKKKKGKNRPAATTTPNQPEFVGPRGQQIPKQ